MAKYQPYRHYPLDNRYGYHLPFDKVFRTRITENRVLQIRLDPKQNGNMSPNRRLMNQQKTQSHSLSKQLKVQKIQTNL